MWSRGRRSRSKVVQRYSLCQACKRLLQSKIAFGEPPASLCVNRLRRKKEKAGKKEKGGEREKAVEKKKAGK